MIMQIIFNSLIYFNMNYPPNNNNKNDKNSSCLINNMNNYTPEEKLLNYKIVPKILKIISNNFTFETDYSNKLFPINNLNRTFLNNISIDNQTMNSKLSDYNKINYANNENGNGNDNEVNSSPSKSINSSSNAKNSFSHNTSIISTPQVRSNIINNETLENLSKISFSQRLPSKNHIHYNNNNLINNKNENDNLINEEIDINSVDIHLGKIRLNQDKFINILKGLFTKVISLNSELFPFKIKKHFIIFLFKIIFQCYLPFETAINYFINLLSQIQSNDIKDFIYIMNAMISSLNTQENYQILINIILPSIQTLCNSIIQKKSK